jgi:hypothetical protein
MPKAYAGYVETLAVTDPALASLVAPWRGLESVLDWIKVKCVPQGSIGLIEQDEFESEFLIELEPGGRWLAFGIT